MGTVRRSLAALAAMVVIGGSVLSAQHPQVRKGFWIGFGLGYGSLHAMCDNCADTTLSGLSAHLRLGGTLSPKILLGGDIVGWSKSSSGNLTENAGNTTAAVYWYPSVTGGFFLKGGAGFSYFAVSSGGTTTSGSGFGFTAGLGYDLRVGRNISLTPVGNLVWGSVGDVTSGLVTFTGRKQRLLDIGLDVTFH